MCRLVRPWGGLPRYASVNDTGIPQDGYGRFVFGVNIHQAVKQSLYSDSCGRRIGRIEDVLRMSRTKVVGNVSVACLWGHWGKDERLGK